MSPEELDALEALANAATPGPWERVEPHEPDCCGCCDEFPHGAQDAIRRVGEEYGEIIQCDSGVYGPNLDDANFIVAARTAIPKLIAELREAREDAASEERWADQYFKEQQEALSAKRILSDAFDNVAKERDELCAEVKERRESAVCRLWRPGHAADSGVAPCGTCGVCEIRASNEKLCAENERLRLWLGEALSALECEFGGSRDQDENEAGLLANIRAALSSQEIWTQEELDEVAERAKKYAVFFTKAEEPTCKTCGGRGELLAQDFGGSRYEDTACPDCQGDKTGEVKP